MGCHKCGSGALAQRSAHSCMSLYVLCRTESVQPVKDGKKQEGEGKVGERKRRRRGREKRREMEKRKKKGRPQESVEGPDLQPR